MPLQSGTPEVCALPRPRKRGLRAMQSRGPDPSEPSELPAREARRPPEDRGNGPPITRSGPPMRAVYRTGKEGPPARSNARRRPERCTEQDGGPGARRSQGWFSPFRHQLVSDPPGTTPRRSQTGPGSLFLGLFSAELGIRRGPPPRPPGAWRAPRAWPARAPQSGCWRRRRSPPPGHWSPG